MAQKPAHKPSVSTVQGIYIYIPRSCGCGAPWWCHFVTESEVEKPYQPMTTAQVPGLRSICPAKARLHMSSLLLETKEHQRQRGGLCASSLKTFPPPPLSLIISPPTRISPEPRLVVSIDPSPGVSTSLLHTTSDLAPPLLPVSPPLPAQTICDGSHNLPHNASTFMRPDFHTR